MPLLPGLPLTLSLVLLAAGLYYSMRDEEEQATQRRVTESVNQCFLGARLGTMARICAVLFVLLLFVDILAALGFAIGAFCSGFMAWRFPQRSYRDTQEDNGAERPWGFAAGLVAGTLAIVSAGGFQTLLVLMTPSGQAVDLRPLWGLGFGVVLAAWLTRIRPASHWMGRRLCHNFPAYCRGSPVQPQAWFELLCLSLILLATLNSEPTSVWIAAWLIVTSLVAALVVRRLLATAAGARLEDQVVLSLLVSATLFLITRPLYLDTGLAQPWKNILGPVLAGIALVWVLLPAAGNSERVPRRLALLLLALLALFLVYGNGYFGAHGLSFALVAVLANALVIPLPPPHQDATGERIVLRFSHLAAAVANLFLVVLLARAGYLSLQGEREAFYDAVIPTGLGLMVLGMLVMHWLRNRESQLLLRWSDIHPATPVNRHSREWPLLVGLGRRYTLDHLVPLAAIALPPVLLQLGGHPAWALAGPVTLALALVPRLMLDALRYRTDCARESQLFDLCRLALVLIILIAPLRLAGSA